MHTANQPSNAPMRLTSPDPSALTGNDCSVLINYDLDAFNLQRS